GQSHLAQVRYVECDDRSSYSGRRTFIANAAKIPIVGGPLRHVQLLAGHSCLRMKIGDHVLENGEVVTFPFIDSPQTFPLSSRVH
ncbi:MAG: hypothetical protein QOH35_5412, partial [Acidobacteriaceae bacterium]|nr:hypothetical protein [Acidobacteriaceae bacterium]